MRVDSSRSNQRVEDNRPDQKETAASAEHSRFKKLLGKPQGGKSAEEKLAEQQLGEKDTLTQQQEAQAEGEQLVLEGEVEVGEVAQGERMVETAQQTIKGDFQGKLDPLLVPGAPGVNASSTQAAQEVQSVRVPRELAAVVDEIHLATNELGDQTMTVNLNSKTMEGLSFQLKKDAATGVIGVEFLSKSPDVTKLLEQNLVNVSQALAQKGIQVGEVRVQPVVTGQQKSGFNFTGSNKPRFQGGRGR